MPDKKQSEFVVTDKRKFTLDGDPLEGAVEESSAEPTPPPAPDPVKPTAPEPAPSAEAVPTEPPPETGYNADSERSAFGGHKIEFIHLLDLLVQTAMMYAGAMDTGAERRVDVVGLRQMIDMIGVVEEKTRGNLTEQEKAVMENTLFQLRMTYMEIINMIQKEAVKGPGSGSPLA
jgi:hypothetical protein